MEGFLCEKCGNVFSSPSNMERHRKTALYCIATNIKYTCECEYSSTIKYNFDRHQIQCLEHIYHLRSKTKTDILETEVEILKDEIVELTKTNNELQNAIDELKAANAELKEQLSYGKGFIAAYKERPVSKVVNVGGNMIKNKLTSVKCDTIRPFTLDTVREDIGNGLYSYDVFINGIDGLITFISNMITQDDQRNYVCTDAARNVFHRLVESREWKKDNGAAFLDNVFNELKPLVEEYHDGILDRIGDKNLSTAEKHKGNNLLDKITPIYNAVSRDKSKERKDITLQIKTKIKELAGI